MAQRGENQLQDEVRSQLAPSLESRKNLESIAFGVLLMPPRPGEPFYCQQEIFITMEGQVHHHHIAISDIFHFEIWRLKAWNPPAKRINLQATVSASVCAAVQEWIIQRWHSPSKEVQPLATSGGWHQESKHIESAHKISRHRNRGCIPNRSLTPVIVRTPRRSRASFPKSSW